MNDDCSDARMPNIYQFNVGLQRRHNGRRSRVWTLSGLTCQGSDFTGRVIASLSLVSVGNAIGAFL